MFQISQIEPTVQTLEQCLTEGVHGIGIIRDYLENLGVERMDVNPIEHLWDGSGMLFMAEWEQNHTGSLFCTNVAAFKGK